MKRRNSSNELKISIEGKVMTVRDAETRLRLHLIRQGNLKNAIEEMESIKDHDTEQAKAYAKLILDQRLNDERIKVYKDPLDAQFPQLVFTTN